LTHPIDIIALEKRKPALFLGLVACGVAIVGMQWTGRFLVGDISPAGIVSFEFSSNVDQAWAIVQSWERMGVILWAELNIGLDFIFLLLYAFCLSLGMVMLSEKLNFWKGLSWLPIIAGGLDAVENVGMLFMLNKSEGAIWPEIAYYCAFAKFTLIALSILIMLLMSIFLISRRRI